MYIKRPITIFILFLSSNLCLFLPLITRSELLRFLIVTVCATFFVLYNILPRFRKSNFTRMEMLMSGREMIIDAFILSALNICFWLLYLNRMDVKTVSVVLCVVTAVVIVILIMSNGVLRLIGASKQLSLVMRLWLLFAWWIPIINIYLCWRACHIARNEYRFLLYKTERNESRKENEICKTKYPLILVHGIFWRDWQLFNYWGRITNELVKNGAVIFYGNQQSAAPIEVSANELKVQILAVLEKEKCEKVNIIAHSKGGLDTRYAISCLGLAPYVASLTTIGTPHRGCSLVDTIFCRLPDSFIRRMAKGYNGMYKRLGDSEPDFRNGIFDLSSEKCAVFNEKVTDQDNVYYQSFASKMSSIFSAGFPLNIGYIIMRRKEGENDGFVSVKSAKWGEFLGVFKTKRTLGVSHGDVIDLTRKDIKGFDVCECYTNIVKGLKEKGL